MDSSRRNFIRSIPALAALPASWTAFSTSLRAAPGRPDATNDAYWSLVKQQFPLNEDLLYLNAANVCPASRPVLDRYAEFLRDFQANPSFQNRAKYDPLRERLRGKIAALLRVSSDEIAITRNTSESNSIIVQGLDLKPGDEIVSNDQNHASNDDSWKVRAKREGFVVKTLPIAVPVASRDQLVSQIEKAVTPRTKVIAITHVSSFAGMMFPAREITEVARRHGIWLHLDGAQSFGAIDVDLKQIGCDSYSASTHKWLMGPLEAGILFVRSERVPQVWPSVVTVGWSDQIVGARKLEVYGQRDDPRMAAVESAIDFLTLIGMDKIEARMRMLAAYMKDQLAQIPAVRMKTNREPELSAGVIKFELSNLPIQRAYDTLWERNRIAIAMTTAGDSRGLRFSPHIYNSREEIDRAVAAIKALAA
ncbi:MAG TPA: aminotransferase class V-fold PLP-dependent enzyme [Bryobacteraceae bacterium]|nr:aminotransferase class V-fold PLP-dependent enzyme [Bryobacteraceae bacterium]